MGTVVQDNFDQGTSKPPHHVGLNILWILFPHMAIGISKDVIYKHYLQPLNASVDFSSTPCPEFRTVEFLLLSLLLFSFFNVRALVAACGIYFPGQG